ncbi:MAG TPA: hypothetical protein VLQ68_11155, partial [Rhizobiaceae bacterium]|nr:hypothetical protein [Rhizobiaceae bacterium]
SCNMKLRAEDQTQAKVLSRSLLLVALCLMLLQITRGHNWGDDFASYIMQAQSLVDGTVPQFMRDNSFTIFNSSEPVGPVAYPWGFPALLAPVYAMFGSSLFGFKLVGAGFYLLFLVNLWRGFGRPLAGDERIFLLAIFCLNPVLLESVNEIGSDLPFLFFSTLSLGLMNLAGQTSLANLSLRLAALGLAMGAAYQVRTNGILLPMVYILLVLWSIAPRALSARLFDFEDCLDPVRDHHRATRLALLALPLVLFALVAAAFSAMLPDGQGSHVSLLADVSLKSIASNLGYYSFLITEFFFPFDWGKAIGLGLYVATAIFVLRGVGLAGGRSLHLLLYVAATLALYVVWPFRQGLRFIFPLLPIYVYFLAIGLFRNPLEMPGLAKFSRPLAVLLPVVFFSVSLSMALRNIEKGWRPPEGPHRQHASEMLAFIRTNTGPGEVVAFRKPRAMRMIGERLSVRILNPQSFGGTDIYVVDKTKRSSQLLPDERETLFRRQKAELIFENRDFQAYRFLKN